MRPKRETVYMAMAETIAVRGTCLRAKVGAAVTVDDRMVAVGYNGSLPDQPHCNDETCTPDSPCKNSVHAEANLIAFAAKNGLCLKGGTLYITHSPCQKCSELIIQSGITKIYYRNKYRDTPTQLLISCGIEIEQYEDCLEESNI